MGQVILGNMWACLVPSLPEPLAGLQLAGVGATEWQAPARKRYASGWSGGIKTGDAGSLKSCLGSGDGGFGEDGRCWAGTDERQSDWEILVKDNL